MIKDFSDHAANERTYLAWIRTSLAIMAAGFVIERFDLFTRPVPAGRGDVDPGAWLLTAEIAGLCLILLGVLVLALSTSRYLRFKQQISSQEVQEFEPRRTDLLLVAIIGSIALFMCFYVVHDVFLSLPVFFVIQYRGNGAGLMVHRRWWW